MLPGSGDSPGIVVMFGGQRSWLDEYSDPLDRLYSLYRAFSRLDRSCHKRLSDDYDPLPCRISRHSGSVVTHAYILPKNYTVLSFVRYSLMSQRPPGFSESHALSLTSQSLLTFHKAYHFKTFFDSFASEKRGCCRGSGDTLGTV